MQCIVAVCWVRHPAAAGKRSVNFLSKSHLPEKINLQRRIWSPDRFWLPAKQLPICENNLLPPAWELSRLLRIRGGSTHFNFVCLCFAGRYRYTWMQKYLLHPPLTIKQQYFSSICPQMFECEGGVDWEELTGWFVTVVFWSDADFVLILCKQFSTRPRQDCRKFPVTVCKGIFSFWQKTDFCKWESVKVGRELVEVSRESVEVRRESASYISIAIFSTYAAGAKADVKKM